MEERLQVNRFGIWRKSAFNISKAVGRDVVPFEFVAYFCRELHIGGIGLTEPHQPGHLRDGGTKEMPVGFFEVQRVTEKTA